MASEAVNRKTTSHTYSSTSASNLDNNLDALLDDLQTSITASGKGPGTPKHSSTSRIVETKSSRQSPLRSASPGMRRSVSPSGRTTTIEKYVSTGPVGAASGIPGLEMLDKELQDVQPGQSKTVAYKQVSYHYDKKQEGNNLEPWALKSAGTVSKNDASIVDDFCERTFKDSSSSTTTYERSRTSRDSPDFARPKNDIIYKADVSTKTIAAPQTMSTETRQTERDFKYIKETVSHTEPSPISPRRNIKTVRTDETEELTNVEYIPAAIPIPTPAPNTKVTTTIKTYTYEIPPSAPVAAAAAATTTTTTKNINVDKSISYSSLPRSTDNTVSHHEEIQKSSMREYVPPPSPASSNRVHREVYLEERRGGYRVPSPPRVTSTTTTRTEKYLEQSNAGYAPTARSVDYPDHALNARTERILYQSVPSPAPPPTLDSTTTSTTVKQYEEHYSGSSRPPKPAYYPETSHHSSTSHVYKQYGESMRPQPFPTSERPASPGQQPPRRIEDLMASFSESEEMTEVMERRERKEGGRKEVDFVPHTPPVVQSRNIAGPPVYYPPGSAEFARKEEAMMMTKAEGGGGWSKTEESMSGMSKASGGWAKEKAAYEYGASSKSEEKTKTKKAVVPVCLPLCCALPCVIM